MGQDDRQVHELSNGSDNQPYSPAHGFAHFHVQESIPPVRATEKPSQKSMLFFNIEKNIDNWDGLGRGERSEGQSKPHSDGLIQLF